MDDAAATVFRLDLENLMCRDGHYLIGFCQMSLNEPFFSAFMRKLGEISASAMLSLNGAAERVAARARRLSIPEEESEPERDNPIVITILALAGAGSIIASIMLIAIAPR